MYSSNSSKECPLSVPPSSNIVGLSKELRAILVDSSVWLEAKNIFNDQKLDQRTKYLLAKKKFYSLLD